MAKEPKTADELKALLDERLSSLGPLTGVQWVKVVPADPAKEGANWRAAQSGEPGTFSDAIDHVMRELQKMYDLAVQARPKMTPLDQYVTDFTYRHGRALHGHPCHYH